MFSRMARLLFVCLTIAVVGWQLSHSVAAAAALIVDDTGDDGDVLPGDGICATSGNVCTLRAAIEELNELGAGATPHLIQFQINGM